LDAGWRYLPAFATANNQQPTPNPQQPNNQQPTTNNQLTKMEDLIEIIREAERDNAVVLDLSDRGITRIPPDIARLKNLFVLYLGFNQLTELPPELFQLTRLTQLDLKNNQLQLLPREIVQLTNLFRLDARWNRLKNLPREIVQLKNLTILDLGDNQISRLPQEIVYMKALKLLNLENNPLIFPPIEVAVQGMPAITDYFNKSDKGGQILHEGKLMIVGQGGAGKTCLIERLTRNEYSEKQITTEGIDIHHWKLKAPDAAQTQMTLNIWDFGGQEIYHATHQFFLTRHSLYILVWDARQEDEQGRLDYWLNILDTFAEDSPVLIVMNKSDERIKDLNLKELRQRYPQIVASGKVSARIGSGIEALRELIRTQAWELPLMGTFWPSSWLAVRRALKAASRYHVPYRAYLQLCKKADIEENEAKTLSRYLHDLGIILHFQDDPLLKDTIILKPEWGTDAVYKVLDAEQVRDRKGILYYTDLPDIWTDRKLYPRDKYATILRLMANFELAFPIGDAGDRYIVAELLPPKPVAYDWEPKEFIQFEYHYDFLPVGVINRLIVRMHEYLAEHEGEKLCWREGAYFEYGGSKARINISPYTKIGIIQIQGPRRREFLKVIRYHFAALHKTVRKIRVKEKVPCICTPGCKHRFDYNFLLKCEEKEKNTQTCQVSVKEVSVAELLDTIEHPEIREERIRKRNETRYPSEEIISEETKPSKTKWYLKKLW
jgi:small GTP-binding protein